VSLLELAEVKHCFTALGVPLTLPPQRSTSAAGPPTPRAVFTTFMLDLFGVSHPFDRPLVSSSSSLARAASISSLTCSMRARINSRFSSFAARNSAVSCSMRRT